MHAKRDRETEPEDQRREEQRQAEIESGWSAMRSSSDRADEEGRRDREGT